MSVRGKKKTTSKPYVTPHTKINSRQITDLNVKAKMKKILGDKNSSSPRQTEISQHTKSMTHKRKNTDKVDFIQMKSFRTLIDTTENMKRKATEEKTLRIHLTKCVMNPDEQQEDRRALKMGKRCEQTLRRRRDRRIPSSTRNSASRHSLVTRGNANQNETPLRAR